MGVQAASAPAGPVAPLDIFSAFVDEVAFESNPFDTDQVWTDVTDRTRLRSWARGRQSENDQADTGTATPTYDNSDRALDPENTGSPFYPNVLPMRRVRCRAVVAGVTYYLYTCFVSPLYGWQMIQDQPGYAEVAPLCNDGFDVLATAQFTADDTLPAQTPGARIAAILDRFDWPTDERTIDDTSSQTNIQARAAGDLTGRSALDEIQSAAATEDGVFFINGEGYAVFQDRYHKLLNERATTPQATFTDIANFTDGDFLYQSLKPSTSAIVNDYLVTREGGVQQEALDTASRDLYRLRSTTLDTLHVTDEEALEFGQYKLAQTKDPHRRYDELVLTPCDDVDLWTIILQLEIGDRVTVKQSPPGGGTPDVRDMHIEAISGSTGPTTEAQITFRLSPAAQVVGWLLGTSTLGVDTVLVY